MLKKIFVFFIKKVKTQNMLKKMIFLGVVIIAFVVFFSIIKLAIDYNSGKCTFGKININNYSFESWVKSTNGKLIPKSFSFQDSEALIERSNIAKEGKYSVLMKQASKNGSFLRYQVDGLKKYKGKRIKLSAWIKSEYKIPKAINIDMQDGIHPVNVVTYPVNGEWQRVELIGEVDNNARSLQITFNPLDANRALYVDDIKLEVMNMDNVRPTTVIPIVWLIFVIAIFYLIFLKKRYLSAFLSKVFSLTSKIPFLSYFKEVPIVLFFIYFLYLCWIYHSQIINTVDFIGVFDNIWFFYHRLLQGFFSQWNPYSLSGRITIQWNQLPVSIFSPFLLFSEFTLTKYKIISIFGTFLSFLSIYLVGRILKYNKFISLIAVLLFIKCGRYLYMATFVGSTTSFFLFPIAIAVLYYFLFKNNLSKFNYFLSVGLLSLSFLGNKTEDFVFKSALILISFIVFGLYQLPDKRKVRNYFLLGIFALIIIFLTNAWQLSFLLNSVLDNPRLSVHANILKLFDPILIKWIFKGLIYQAPLILCIINMLILKILERRKPNILSKKLFIVFPILITAIEIIFLGLMYHSEKIGFSLYWLSNNPEIYKTAMSLQSTSIIIILFYQYYFNQTKSLKKLLINLASIFAGCYIAQISFFIWYREFSIPLVKILFFLIIGGSLSFIIRKKQPWLITVMVIYLFIGETGIYFLNEIAGIPWVSIRANLSLIPCLAIVIFEGMAFLTTILSDIAYNAIKLFKKVNRSSVDKITFNIVGIACIFIAFCYISNYFVPVVNNTYTGSYFFKPTSIEDVKINMTNKDTYKYQDSIIYEAYSYTELIKSHHKDINHFKRIFVNKYIKNGVDVVSHTLPSYLERINTIGLYNSDIPKTLARIFHEVYNDKLTIHPEIAFQQHFMQYKFEDVKERGETVNSDFGSSVGITPDMHNNQLFNEVLARDDSKTPRAFLCKDVLQFNDYKEEYNYLKNNITNKGLPLTNVLTTSDKSFKVPQKNKTDESLVYTIKFNKDEPEDIELEIKSNIKAYLILLDTFDSGWKCYINNKVTPIYKAYVGMRFIAINPGEQLIKFKYSLPWFFPASIVSVTTWLLVIFILILLAPGRKIKNYAIK